MRIPWVRFCYSCPAASNWWERSPNGSNSTNFCLVGSNGNANNNNASNSNGVAFGFRNSNRTDTVAPTGVNPVSFTEGEPVPGYMPKYALRWDQPDAACMAENVRYSVSWLKPYAVRTRTRQSYCKEGNPFL